MRLAVRINLLDWRAAEREYKRRQFIAVLIGAALTTILVVGVLPMVYYGHRLAAQRARNDYLQHQIAIANRQLKQIHNLRKTRAALIDRMQIIGRLQHSRSAIVHYFDQIAATVPNGLYLLRLDQKNATTTIRGVAESNARISQYMTNLDASPWFTNPRLVVIKRDEQNGQRRAQFTLKVDNASPDGRLATTAGGKGS